MTAGWMVVAAILLPAGLLWCFILPVLVRIERRLPPVVRVEPWEDEA